MPEKSPEMFTAELLQGPFGGVAVKHLLEMVGREAEEQERIEQAVRLTEKRVREVADPIEARIRMDRTSLAILERRIDPGVVALDDWFAVRAGFGDVE